MKLIDGVQFVDVSLVTCNDSPCFIFPSAVSEEGVHHVRLVAEDGHDVGNGLDPNVIN